MAPTFRAVISPRKSIQFIILNNLLLLFCIHGVHSNPLSDPNIPKVCPEIVSRIRWGGRTPIQVDYTIIPIKYVVVHHTVTEDCDTETECASLLKSIQNFHMDELEFDTIGYNFLVGGDGRIYEGAGWHKIGAHTRGYNSKSLGLAFVGNFTDKRPNSKQVNAAKDFLQCGVQLGELDENYKLFGARQVSPTQSPGLRLYHDLRNWPHFIQNPKEIFQKS